MGFCVTTAKSVLQQLKARAFRMRIVVAEATTYKNPLGSSAESRSLSASRARQSAAGKKKRGTPFGMTRCSLFRRTVRPLIIPRFMIH